MKFGRYEVVNSLGRGGMAEVYRAYDPMLDRYVAVKVILPHLVADEKFEERFFQEAKLVASLRHPNIVKIHDFGIENDQPYMVMEHLDHGTLQDRISQLSAEKRTMPLEEIERRMDALAIKRVRALLAEERLDLDELLAESPAGGGSGA